MLQAGSPPAPLSRRLFLAFGSGVAVPANAGAAAAARRYGFATPECEIRVAVEFYDRYTGNGFWFSRNGGSRIFCVSAQGALSRGCLAGFVGSLAIARYRFVPRPPARRMAALREHVVTLDQDSRLLRRAPFDRSIELQDGLASDIQAFGLESPPSSAEGQAPEAGGPWYYFRQDLYLEAQPAPFLVVHWRHGFGGIRLLDMIPGNGTRASA
jgi:hypothetical protein